MAVRWDAASDRLLRTSDLIDFDTNYTWMGWIYPTSDLNAFVAIFTLNTNGTNDQDFMGFDATGLRLVLFVDDAGSFSEVAGSTLSTNTWYHVALVREGVADLRLYLNGTQDIQNTLSVSRGAPTRMEMGGNLSTDIDRYDGRIAYVKAWSTGLTNAQVLAEINAIRPVSNLADLYGFWPLFPGSGERVRDYSGNGRDWTEGGTLTDEDPPPVGWGAQVYMPPFFSSIPDYELEGYRFRNDDGSETTATWRQSQDVADSIAKNTNVRLRTLINTDLNAPLSQYTLKYRRSGDNTWLDVGA